MTDQFDFPAETEAAESAFARMADCLSREEFGFLLKDLRAAHTEVLRTGKEAAFTSTLDRWWRSCLIREGGKLAKAFQEADEIDTELRERTTEGKTVEALIDELRSA